MSPFTQRRKFFRINYTSKNCPFFMYQAQSFQVMDLSEEGFRIEMPSSSGLEIEMEVSGSLNFRDGESFLVHGTIQRLVPHGISVKLKHLLPLRKIMSEQRLLIQKQKNAS